MKKNPNLVHLLESFALSALLTFFLFFMKRGEDAFFAITIGFSAFAFLFSMLMIYIDGDKTERGVCKLLPIARSDLAFYAQLLQFALAIVFSILHNLSEVSISVVTVIYSILPVVEFIILFIPAPREATPPAPTNEGGVLRAKSFDYYAGQLRKLIQKCEYESLSNVMEKTADLLSRLDTEFCVQPDALENDVSHKCVKIENALLTHNASQLVLLERELSATVELIEKRLQSHKYCLKEDDFYAVNDEIAMSQIDLLLDKLGLEYEEDLPTAQAPIDGEFFYKKALKFASEEYAALLADYNRRIVERIEKEAADQAARRLKKQSLIGRACHIVCLLLALAIGTATLLWHTVLQPNGLVLTENDDGSYSVVGYNPIYGDDLTIPATIGNKHITSVGREALMKHSLRRIELAEGIETIEYQSIRDCIKLEEIILPKSLTSIENYAFKADVSLKKVYFRGSEADWEKVSVGNLGNDEFEKIEIEFEYQG